MSGRRGSAAAAREPECAAGVDAEADVDAACVSEARLRDVVDSIVRHGAAGDLSGGGDDTAPTVMCSVCEGMNELVAAYTVAKHHPGGGPVEVAALYICADCQHMAEEAAAELRNEIREGRA